MLLFGGTIWLVKRTRSASLNSLQPSQTLTSINGYQSNIPEEFMSSNVISNGTATEMVNCSNVSNNNGAMRSSYYQIPMLEPAKETTNSKDLSDSNCATLGRGRHLLDMNPNIYMSYGLTPPQRSPVQTVNALISEEMTYLNDVYKTFQSADYRQHSNTTHAQIIEEKRT